MICCLTTLIKLSENITKLICPSYHISIEHILTESERTRINEATANLRKGGTLLSEPCQKCGGVQIKLQNKITCVSCGSDLISKEKKPSSTIQSTGFTEMLDGKIAEIMLALKNESSVDTQIKLIDLITKYFDLLDRINKTPKVN